MTRVAALAWIVTFGMAVLPAWAEPSYPFAPSPPRLRHLSVDEGLRHSVVYNVGQDRVGFVWLATEGGLVRYDGTQFTHFDNRPFGVLAPSSQDASYVLADRHGGLWIGTWGGGLERFDLELETFRHYVHDPADPRSLPDDRVQTLLETADGTLWIGTFRGLARFVPRGEGPVALGPGGPGKGDFDNFHASVDGTPGGLPSDRIWAMAEDGRGGLWLGTDRGLVHFDPKSGRVGQVYRHDPARSDSLSHDEVRTVALDRSGTLWVGTQAGLDRLDQAAMEPGRFVRYQARPDDPAGLPGSTVNVVLEDRRGNLWVGTQYGGLARLDRETGQFTRLAPDPVDRFSLSHPDVRSLFEDRNGVLWIATRGGGVNLLDLHPSPLELYVHRRDDPASLGHPTVLSVWKDDDGTLWVGTLGGLDRIRDGRITHYRRRAGTGGLPNDQIQALRRDRAGRLWIGTYAGLCKLIEGPSAALRDTQQFDCHRHDPGNPNSLAHDRIQALLEDRNGQLWVGTRRGLDRYDHDTGVFSHYHHDPQDPATLSDDFVMSLLEDRDGQIWVGTDVGGLSRLDPVSGQVRRFEHDPNDPETIANNRVQALLEEPSGVLWVGTRRGLDRFDTQAAEPTFVHFGEAEGLPNASVQGLLRGDDGALWVASNRGLARFDPESREVLAFDPADGLQGWLFGRAAAVLSADGEMIFGGLEGLNRFYPQAAYGDQATPALTLTGLRLGNRPAALPRSIATTRHVELGYRERFFVFQYAALDYLRPFRYHFQYRLVGFNEEWVAAGARREAVYTNVDPGSYRFEVRVSGRRGEWSPPGIAVDLTIVPPFWQTLWFRAAGLLLLVALAMAAHSWRLRWVGRERKRLERLVGETSGEIERQREKLAALNDIVRVVNAELELAPMLGAILSGVGALVGADRGAALVRDRGGERLVLRAAVGGGEAAIGESFDPTEVEAALRAAVEVVPQVFVGPSKASRVAAALAAALEIRSLPRRVMAFRVDVGAADDHALGERRGLAGYLLFGRSEGQFADESPAFLGDLRDHLVAAFVKGRLLEELRDLNTTKNEFLAIAAHDLRSPLGGIIGYSDLLLRLLSEGRLEAVQGGRFLHSIGRTARQMVGLINDLLDVAALESGKSELLLEPVALGELLEERFALQQSQAAAKELTFSLTLGAEPSCADATFVADRGRIGEVLDNLLANAIKFTERGGAVTLAASADEHEVSIRVIDTGQGLRRDELVKVFSGGRLSARPTAGEPSTGLGLVIARKIVDRHGGKLWVESEKGRGSTFGFRLPRGGPAGQTVTAAASSASSAPAPRSEESARSDGVGGDEATSV